MQPAMHISRSDVEKFAGANTFEALPLPSNFFPRLSLSTREREDYVASARSLLQDALERLGDATARAASRREWKDLGSHAGLRRFAQREGNTQRFRIEGPARATLESLMGALVADSTAAARARRTSLFRDLLDLQTLAVLQPRSASAADEFLALRWHAVSLGASAASQHWDMVVLEFTGVTAGRDGRPVGFHVSTSVERRECGLLKQSYGLSRLRGTEVVLLLPTAQPGLTDVVLDGVWLEPEMVSSWVVQSFLAGAAAALSKLAQLVQDRLLARLPLCDKATLVPPGERKACGVCLAKFGLMGKKSNCRSCGDVVCRACVVSRSGAHAAVKFCKRCLVEASASRRASFSVSSEHSFDRESRSSSAASVRESGVALVSSTASRRSEASSSGSGGSGGGHGHNLQTAIVAARAQPKSCGDRGGYGFSMASTASVSSYDGSSFSDSWTDRGDFADVDEDGVIVVSARSAARALGAPRGAAVPTVQAVEDSIAHQRFLLHEMMAQARTYQQQQHHQGRAHRQHP